MPNTRKPYTPEFREQLVALVRAGRTPEDLAREFEPTAQSIGNWVALFDSAVSRSAPCGSRFVRHNKGLVTHPHTEKAC